MKREIFIKTSFAALHNWPDCPFEEVKYLKDYHRHVFHVTAYWKVNHDNRDIEFIMMKREVEAWIGEWWKEKHLPGVSCEMMAIDIIDLFGCSKVTVSEDNENGATIEK